MVHEIKLYEQSGCGAQFINRIRRLKRIIKKLENFGCQRRPEKIFSDKAVYLDKSTSISEKIFPVRSIKMRNSSENDSSEEEELFRIEYPAEEQKFCSSTAFNSRLLICLRK